MKKKKKKKRLLFSDIAPVLILVSVLFMCIGYASINSISLDIKGEITAQAQDGIFITKVDYLSDVNADVSSSKILNAYQTNLSSNIVLSNTDGTSSITYEVTIYNSNAEDYAFDQVSYLIGDDTYSNEEIIFELNGLTYGDILGSKQSITFTITFYYKNNQLAENNTLQSLLNFNFEKVYYVTYENFSSTSSYPTHVLEGNTLSIFFGTLDAPIEVKKDDVILSSSDYSYSSYVLTINSVDGDIHVRKLTKYTIKNMVTNGSFEDGLNGWTISGSSSSWGIASIPAFGSKSAYRVASGASSNFLMQNISGWVSGHKYYFFGYASSVTTQSFVCNITNKGGKFTQATGPTSYLKGRVIYTADFTGSNSISINYAASTDNINVDGIGLVDLTACFGAGNEPSLSWCNANINYFDGSTTVYK